MIRRRFLWMAIAAAAVLGTGCLTPLLLAESTTPMAGRSFQVVGPTTAESCQDSILGIPLSRDASLFSALETARLAVGAEALVEVVVDKWTLTTFFYNKRCTQVHAKGIRFTSLLSNTQAAAAPAAVPGAAPAAPAGAGAQPEPAKPAAAKEEPKPEALPAKPETVAEKRTRLAEEKKKVEEEKKKAAEEKKRADEEARKAAEDKKKAEDFKRKAEEEAKHKAEEAERLAQIRKSEEEHKPIPEEYWPFCKFQAGDPIRVETKAEVIEAEFVECVNFGIKVKTKGQDAGVVPFERIWSVTKVPAAAPAPAQPAPAQPAQSGKAVPAAPAGAKEPAKPAPPPPAKPGQP